MGNKWLEIIDVGNKPNHGKYVKTHGQSESRHGWSWFMNADSCWSTVTTDWCFHCVTLWDESVWLQGCFFNVREVCSLSLINIEGWPWSSPSSTSSLLHLWSLSLWLVIMLMKHKISVIVDRHAATQAESSSIWVALKLSVPWQVCVFQW